MGSEWKSVVLKDLTESVNTGLDAIRRAPIVAHQTGIKCLRIQDISQNKPFHLWGDTEVKQSDYDKYRLIKDDIIMARTCSTGINLLIKDSLNAVFNNGLARLRLKKQYAHPEYMYYVFQSREFINHISGISGGTSVQLNMKIGDLTQYEFYLPSLIEQRAIAHILGTLDDKVELNRRMNETLEAMARAIFKSWFVDFDPVRAKAEGRKPEGMDAETAALFPDGFEDSELGEIPRGWAIATLKEITTKIGSGATPRGGGKTYLEEGVSLIRSQNVYDSEFRWDGLAKISDEAAEQLKGVTVQQDDVLINITGASILRTCIVESTVLPARVNQHVAIIRAMPLIPPGYIYLHMLQYKTKNYLLGMNAGASREAITKGHIESVQLLLPPQGVLDKFQSIFQPIHQKIEQLVNESRNLAAMRDTLLPKLLSGVIRVKEAESLVGDVA